MAFLFCDQIPFQIFDNNEIKHKATIVYVSINNNDFRLVVVGGMRTFPFLVTGSPQNIVQVHEKYKDDSIIPRLATSKYF